MPGVGNWVGVKGELSLASPNPQRGFGLARDSLGRFFWRVGDEGWGCEGTGGRRQRRWVGGRGEGLGWRASRAEEAGLKPALYERWRASGSGSRGVRGARSRRRRASMVVPGEGRGIEGVSSVH